MRGHFTKTRREIQQSGNSAFIPIRPQKVFNPSVLFKQSVQITRPEQADLEEKAGERELEGSREISRVRQSQSGPLQRMRNQVEIDA